jgi:pre-rRNA-processing protein TSR3
MRSSGSTRSRSPDRPIPLLLLVVGEDHPKACTGRRLVHRGAVRSVGRVPNSDPRPVLLDPHAPTVLSAADRARALDGGLLAVDCSWNRLARRGTFPEVVGSRSGAAHRRLPLLIAANPQHYGRLGELNTVEALSAALYVLGDRAPARTLLEGFRGGPAFLDVNRARLDRYAAGGSADEVVAAERALFGGG